jgi:thioredoxin 1
MSAANVVALTDKNFNEEVIKSAVPVLVDFWAEWCGPCKMIGPIIDEMATEYSGRIKIGKVNVDDQQQLAGQFKISSIPTLLIFKGGQVVEQMMGARSKRDIKASLDKVA